MSTTYQEQINLSNVIGPAFYNCHWDILDGIHTYYDLYGGRGSLKSSFASGEIIFGMMQDKDANAIVFRKVANTLRESVFEQIQWAIDEMGVSHLWESSVSPLRFTYKPTGQKIVFRGLDKAKKLKSIKCAQGYFKFLWFEELDEFAGEEEIRNVQQSVMRGGSKFIVFKTFNPPIRKNNWANVYVDTPRADAYRLKTDYTMSPKEWLGQQFIDDAEHLMLVNPKAYKHEYKGEAIGLGTDIFELLEIRAITDAEIFECERIFQGQDWGWYPDPKAFVRVAYLHNKETILVLDELGGNKIRVKDMAKQIVDKGYDDYEVVCGADEGESVIDFKDCGLPARKTQATPGSVKYTMEWLQCRKIIVDPARTPNLYREMTNYELEVDANGVVIDRYPDKNNHWIDALRYATSPMSLRRGECA